jgi:hypothetical protein
VTPKREIDLTQRSRSDHADRGRGDRIRRLRDRLDKVQCEKPQVAAAQLVAIFKAMLDLLSDEL